MPDVMRYILAGARFGARAYADNPQGDDMREVIRYCHRYGVKVYMTVNTLLKPGGACRLLIRLYCAVLSGRTGCGDSAGRRRDALSSQTFSGA